MTTKLTDSQKQTIRIALLRWAGWEAKEEPDGSGFWCLLNTRTGKQLGYHNGLNADHAIAVLAPRYDSSLDSCHEIELKLTDEQHWDFIHKLEAITDTLRHRHFYSASAEHRALALFRALNLGELGD